MKQQHFARRCIVIEDSMVGLRSAKGAGMHCVITPVRSFLSSFHSFLSSYVMVGSIRSASLWGTALTSGHLQCFSLPCTRTRGRGDIWLTCCISVLPHAPWCPNFLVVLVLNLHVMPFCGYACPQQTSSTASGAFEEEGAAAVLSTLESVCLNMLLTCCTWGFAKGGHLRPQLHVPFRCSLRRLGCQWHIRLHCCCSNLSTARMIFWHFLFTCLLTA